MVISTVNQVVYNGDGITTAWPYTFRIIDATDIKLTIIDADGTETDITSDYYVDTVNNTVYYPGYAPGAEPPAEDQPPVLADGQKLVVYREIPITQEKDLGEKWPFYVIELGLDKLTMILQQMFDWWGRTLKFPIGWQADHPDFDSSIPIEAGKTWRVNDDGTGFVASDSSEEAMATAEEAKETADAAALAAGSAVSVANEAKNTADGIAGTANAALQTANSASQIATQAKNTADGLADSVQSAIETAGNAKDTADKKVDKSFFTSLRSFGKVAELSFDGYYYAQGGTFNSKTGHIIVAIVKNDNSTQKLLEINPADYTVINTYTYTQLGHCNSITYCADNDKIYVATLSNGGADNHIAIVNATSMQYESTVTISENVVNIAYDPIVKRFVCVYGNTSVSTFRAHFYDLSLNYLGYETYQKPWTFASNNGVSAYNGQFVHCTVAPTGGFINCDYDGNVLVSCAVNRNATASAIEVEDCFVINGVLYGLIATAYGYAELYAAYPGREAGNLDVYAMLSYARNIDLNNLTTPGIYWASTNADPSTSLHYPTSSTGQVSDGYLLVLSERLGVYPNVVKQMLWRKNDGYAINTGSNQIYIRQWNAVYNAWTEWSRADACDSLSLSGGTLTGPLNWDLSGKTIYISPSDTFVNVGWSYANGDGALAAFRSSTHGNPGSFAIYAKNGSTESALFGTPNGQLTWGGISLCLASSSNVVSSECVDFNVTQYSFTARKSNNIMNLGQYISNNATHSQGDLLMTFKSGYRPLTDTRIPFTGYGGASVYGYVKIAASTGECTIDSINSNSTTARICFGGCMWFTA